MTQFEITTVARDRYKLSGELDMASAPALSDALGPIVDECRRLTLDLEDLTFIDSSGIRAFVELSSRLDGSGPLVLTNVSDGVHRLLEIVGLDTLPNIQVASDV
jgi:anti-sigma B factor antagonist